MLPDRNPPPRIPKILKEGDSVASQAGVSEEEPEEAQAAEWGEESVGTGDANGATDHQVTLRNSNLI